MKRNKKKKLGALFVGSMAIIGIGFAALSNIDLKITGNASVGPNTDAFNVRFVNVQNDSYSPLKCEITSDTTVACTANLKEAYNYESSNNTYGTARIELLYTGSDDISAEISHVVNATGNTENIEVGVKEYFRTNGEGFAGGPSWEENQKVNLLNNERLNFQVYLNAADAKSGDSVDFEIKLRARPVER